MVVDANMFETALTKQLPRTGCVCHQELFGCWCMSWLWEFELRPSSMLKILFTVEPRYSEPLKSRRHLILAGILLQYRLHSH